MIDRFTDSALYEFVANPVFFLLLALLALVWMIILSPKD